MEMLSMGERSKSKHKLGANKVCEADIVKEYFINPKTEYEAFGQFVNMVCFSEKFRSSLVKVYCQKYF